MPLIFWLQAGLARLVQALSTLTLDSSIMLASKLFDSIVPALAAIPAFLLALRWSGSQHSVWAGIAAAALAVISSGPLRMVRDFQKNALGMVWVLSYAYCLQQGLDWRSWRHLAAAGLFLGLVGVTHIGAFGVTLALVVLVVLGHGLSSHQAGHVAPCWPSGVASSV
jgi:asparagine N-glycosylation enzyme membrane subunit Stt3